MGSYTRACLILSFLICCQSLLISQDLPSTSVYSFSFIKDAERLRIKSASLLSGFNKGGYNNQPSFIDDNSLFVTTDYYGEKTEIVKLDQYEKKIYRITKTVESEYSPILLSDQKNFAVVRVEKDNTTQHLHSYPMHLEDKGKTVYDEIENVGYFTYDQTGNVYLFLVDEPHKLAFVDRDTKKSKVLFQDIGRTLKCDKYNQLIFIHKVGDQWLLKSYNPNTQTATIIDRCLHNVEDFEYLSTHELIMAKDGIIYKLNMENNIGWREYVDLNEYGITNITRMIIRKNKLVVVTQDN